MRTSAHIIAFFILTACQSKDKLNGYWQGTVENPDGKLHNKIVYFENGDCILNNVIPDSFSYYLIGSRIRFIPKIPDEKFALKYNLQGDSLVMYRDSRNPIEFRLKKLTTSLPDKLINRAELNIPLPNYKAISSEIYDLDWPDEHFIFFDKVNGSVIVKHLDNQCTLDLSTFHFIENSLEQDYDFYKRPYYLLIDKEINNQELKLIIYNLKLASIQRPKLILESSSIDSINYLAMRLSPPGDDDFVLVPDSLKSAMQNLPPAPPSFLEMDKDFILNYPKIILCKDSINNKGYLKSIKEKIMNSSQKYVVLVNIDETEDYDSYCHQHSTIYELIGNLRDDYSLRKYGKRFDLLNDWQQDEVVKVIPYRVSDASMEEVDYIKYVLQQKI